MLRSLLIGSMLFVSVPVMAAEIHVDSKQHKLIATFDTGESKTYTVGVGKSGLGAKHGVYTVENKKLHPSWTPTPNMLKGKQAVTVPPGPHNPLGIAKLYLSGPEEYIGIHGTNNENSVGKDVSHGCFRMHMWDILELYNNIPIGTKVYVE